jgi:hypothetical protein
MTIGVIAVAINILAAVVNVVGFVVRERRVRRIRHELDALAPLIGFVAALADDACVSVPDPIRELARDVLPAWVDPRVAPPVRPAPRAVH